MRRIARVHNDASPSRHALRTSEVAASFDALREYGRGLCAHEVRSHVRSARRGAQSTRRARLDHTVVVVVTAAQRAWNEEEEDDAGGRRAPRPSARRAQGGGLGGGVGGA